MLWAELGCYLSFPRAERGVSARTANWTKDWTSMRIFVVFVSVTGIKLEIRVQLVLTLSNFCGPVLDQSVMNCGFLIEFKVSDLSCSKIRPASQCLQHHYYHTHIIHCLLAAQLLYIYRPGIHNLDELKFSDRTRTVSLTVSPWDSPWKRQWKR